jgi:sulfite exporter TauE/SafE
MLAFGLGTLPSMLGLTLAAPALASVLRDIQFRRFIGLSLILLAAWMVFSIVNMGSFNLTADGSAHHH